MEHRLNGPGAWPLVLVGLRFLTRVKMEEVAQSTERQSNFVVLINQKFVQDAVPVTIVSCMWEHQATSLNQGCICMWHSVRLAARFWIPSCDHKHNQEDCANEHECVRT